MSHPSPIREIPDSLTPPFAWKQEVPETSRAAHAEAAVPSGEMDLRSGSKGPVTASRHRRNAVVYGILCVLAILPTLLQMPAGWQAFGLGLFMPGAGFLAVGGWAVLLFPLTVGVFWLSVVAWFWAGMVVAPVTVWLGSAVLAAAMVGSCGMGAGAVSRAAIRRGDVRCLSVSRDAQEGGRPGAARDAQRLLLHLARRGR